MSDGVRSGITRRMLSWISGQQFGGERDIYEVCGYTRYISAWDYHATYQRTDIAARVVDAYADATWGEAPAVLGQDGKPLNGFDQLASDVDLWSVLHRLDRMTALGHYGVLMIGLDGGEPMQRPVGQGDHGLLYLQPHGERTADILRWNNDPTSSRYGQPQDYRITTGVNWTGAGAGSRSMNVHHSRVIHVAERAMEDRSIGTPRLERIFNRLFDLEKLLGGGAEIFWSNAAQLLALKADADTQWEPEEQQDLQNQLEEMQHRMRRALRVRGVDVEQLSTDAQGQHAASLIDKQVEFIASATGIPKRILIGSERGELASSQDETAWAQRIAERRNQHVTPNVLVPLIDRLMQYGALRPQPYRIEWPEDDTLGAEKRATIAKTSLEAVSAYTGVPGNETVVSPREVRELIGLDENTPQAPSEDPLDEDDEQVQEQFRRAK